MSFNFQKLKKNFSGPKTKLLWILASISFLFFIYSVIDNADKPTHGFATYYTSSHLLMEGKDVSKFYDEEWFSKNVKRFTPRVFEIYHVNMPTTSLLVLALAKFDYSTARIIWLIINVFLLFSSIYFLILKLGIEEFLLPLIIILTFTFQPLYANIFYAQAYILIFYLLIAAWYAYTAGNEKILGITLGLMFVLKTAGLLLLLLLLLQKRWKGLFFAFVTIFSIAIISLPWIGIEAWQTYVDKIISFTSNPSLSVTAYQTIHSIFHHLFEFDLQWNPKPAVNFPLAGTILSIISVTIILIVSSYFALRKNKSEIVFSMFVTAGIIISPASLDYHYVLLLLPVIIIINYFRNGAAKKVWILLVIFIAMVAIDLPYTSYRLTEGLLAIFAYPKLYGAVGLFGLTAWILYDGNSNDEIGNHG